MDASFDAVDSTWPPAMKTLYRNLLHVCRERGAFEPEALAEDLDLLKAAARGSKKEQNEATNLRNWLKQNRLQFYDKVAAALSALRHSSGLQADETQTEPQEIKIDPDIEPLEEKAEVLHTMLTDKDINRAKRKSDGDVAALLLNLEEQLPVSTGDQDQNAKGEEAAEGNHKGVLQVQESFCFEIVEKEDIQESKDPFFVEYKAIFNRNFTHSENGVELCATLPRQGIAETQAFLNALMVKTLLVTSPGGKDREIKVTFTNTEAISSLLNCLQYLVSEGNFTTAIGFLVVKNDADEDEEEANLRLELFSEISIPNPYVSKRVSNAILSLLVKWFVDPSDLLKGEPILVDCLQYKIPLFLCKLRIRSGHILTMCTGCEMRKTRLPYLTWYQFSDAAAVGTFRMQTGQCKREPCEKRLAYQTIRTNGCCVFVLGPEENENRAGFVMDAALLHETKGFIDEARIDGNELRCQAAFIQSYLGLVVVARGRGIDSPWVMINPTHPDAIHDAEGVVGQVLVYAYVLK